MKQIVSLVGHLDRVSKLGLQCTCWLCILLVVNKNALAVVRGSFYNYFTFNKATIEIIELLTQPSVSISFTNQIQYWKCVKNLNTIEKKYLFQKICTIVLIFMSMLLFAFKVVINVNYLVIKQYWYIFQILSSHKNILVLTKLFYTGAIY